MFSLFARKIKDKSLMTKSFSFFKTKTYTFFITVLEPRGVNPAVRSFILIVMFIRINF